MRISPLLLLLCVCAVAAPAQDASLRGSLSEGAPLFGFRLGAAVPLGQFNQFVGVGGELDGALLLHPFGRQDRFGLRIDVAYVIYGSETQTVPLLPSTGRIVVDVTTNGEDVVAGFSCRLDTIL